MPFSLRWIDKRKCCHLQGLLLLLPVVQPGDLAQTGLLLSSLLPALAALVVCWCSTLPLMIFFAVVHSATTYQVGLFLLFGSVQTS